MSDNSGPEAYELERIKKYKYSLKFVLISNFCSFFTGIVFHYLTDHH